MKLFSQEQIKEQEKAFLDKKYPIRHAYIQGLVNQEYFLLPQELAPDLANFVFRMTGEDTNNLYGISETVPTKFQKYAIAHEVIEFEHAHKKGHGDDACIYALKQELALVPKEIKPAYMRMRRDFFAQLETYANKYEQAYTDADRHQFSVNAQTLEELLKTN